MNYPIVIHKDPDSEYGVSFPNLLGCITAGATIEEARQNAVEAAELYLEDMIEDGEPIPVAGKIDNYVNLPEYANAIFWSIVNIDLSKLKNVVKRINITVPERELAVIDKHASSLGMKRSAFLVSAALEKIYG